MGLFSRKKKQQYAPPPPAAPPVYTPTQQVHTQPVVQQQQQAPVIQEKQFIVEEQQPVVQQQPIVHQTVVQQQPVVQQTVVQQPVVQQEIPGAYPGGAAAATTYAGQPASPIPQQQNVPWIYPPNYMCAKCHNTGLKLKNGQTCSDCYERFGRPAPPPAPTVVHRTAPTVVVRPMIRPVIPLVARTRRGTTIVRGPNATVVRGRNATIIRPRMPRVMVVPGVTTHVSRGTCGRCHGRGVIADVWGSTRCRECNGVGHF